MAAAPKRWRAARRRALQASLLRVLGLTAALALALFAVRAFAQSTAEADAGIGSSGSVWRAVASDPAEVCERAIRRAAVQHDVPTDLLLAIGAVESGRGSPRRPWPWTINVEGAGTWFDARAEAQSAVADARRGGSSSIDIGCMQVNWRWHGASFASIDAMFDPDANAEFAARFLRELFEESGDWMIAAGNYHSRTPRFHDRYRARVADALSDPSDLALAATPPPPRRATTAARPSAAGSLFGRAEGLLRQPRRTLF